MLQYSLKHMRTHIIDWYAILFDVLLVIVTMGGIWLLPFGSIAWVNLEALFLIFNAITIVMLYNKWFQGLDYKFWAGEIGIGIVLTVLAILSSPRLLNSMTPLLHGNLEESIQRLNSGQGVGLNGFVMFVGLLCIYAAVVGAARIAFLGLLAKFKKYQRI